jgi:NADP-dependent 3-hydroxy acid dehydrogenase YdfG
LNGIAVQANVGNEKDIINVIQKADEHAGGTDIFCSNAGIGGVPGFFEVEASDWQNIWDVNVQSHIFAAKHVLPQMIERGEGLSSQHFISSRAFNSIGSSRLLSD